MNDIFNGIKNVVVKYGGFIERSAGDSILALFGVPKAHEDDPIRAIHAAKEIHSHVEAISPKYKSLVGRTLYMHSGINTGVVVTADVNQKAGTHGVTGDTINVSARLSDLSEACEIYVGPETYRLSKNQFSYQALTPTRVKGKSEPIPVYKLITKEAPIPRTYYDRKITSYMVGRDRELNQLERQIIRAINGEGSVINVTGEAGIGKSRLIAELKKKPVMNGVVILEGRAIAIGSNLSYHPVVDLLKQWAGIAESDSEVVAINKLNKAICLIDPSGSEEILPYIVTLMGMKPTKEYAKRLDEIEGEALEKIIIKNIRELLIKGSELRPTLIIMEDLHWADRSSIEILEKLYNLAENYKIVFINLYRPGFINNRERNISDIGKRSPGNFLEIKIESLKKNDSETLIQNMMMSKDLPYSIRDQIVVRAGGNPFYIEEVVRSLIDDGAIVRDETGFQVTEKIVNVVIPATINDVLIARIDRLEEQTKELIKVASVIGRSFFYRIIKNVADSIDDIDTRLSYLKDVQFIKDRIRMQELEYLFKHALAQGAAYESILLKQRKALHLKVAKSIESIFQKRLQEFYGVLAYHFVQAGDIEKSEIYMTKAGEEALRTSASNESIKYFQQALHFYKQKHQKNITPIDIAQFEKNIAIAYYNKSKHQQALPYFDRVLDSWGIRPRLSKYDNTIQLVIDLLVILIRIYLPFTAQRQVPGQRLYEAIDLAMKRNTGLASLNPTRCFSETIGILRESFRYDLSKIPNMVVTRLQITTFMACVGFTRFSDLLLKNSKQLNSGAKIRDIVIYQTALTVQYFLDGSWDKIPNYDHSLVDDCEKNGLFWEITLYSIFQSLTRSYQGDFKLSKKIVSNLILLEERYQNIIVARNLVPAELFALKSNFLKAYDYATKAAAVASEKGMEPYGLQALGWRAVSQIHIGDLGGAEKTLMEADRVSAKKKFWPSLYISSSAVAKFLLDLKNMENPLRSGSESSFRNYSKNALKSGNKAIKISKKFPAHRPWSYRLMGKFYWLKGKRMEAFKWFGNSIKEGERLGAMPELSRTYFEVGKCLLESRSNLKELHGMDAQYYINKARNMFENMDLKDDLAALEKIAH